MDSSRGCRCNRLELCQSYSGFECYERGASDSRIAYELYSTSPEALSNTWNRYDLAEGASPTAGHVVDLRSSWRCSERKLSSRTSIQQGTIEESVSTYLLRTSSDDFLTMVTQLSCGLTSRAL